MAFLDLRFPVDISFGAIGGPGFLTDIVITNSGVESRDQTRSMDLGAWEVSHVPRFPEMYKRLQSFFRIAAGRANTFRFKDWSDFTVTASEGVLSPTDDAGSPPLTWQLYKRYTFGSITFDRKIVLPISAITVTGGSGVSVAYSTGVVTVSSGTPTSWSGEFDVLARFDTDRMHGQIIERNPTDGLLVEWASIPIVEVRG